MKFYVFRHTWQDATDSNRKDLIDYAFEGNFAFMQYEYDHQDNRMVTINWNVVKEIKIGDVIFLASDNKIHAWGFAKKVYVDDNELNKCVTLNCQSIIYNKSHNVGGINFDSGNGYNGYILFDDCDVFYEDLSDDYWSRKDGWGQRIGVYKWLDYKKNGISSYGIGESESSPYGVIKRIEKDLAEKFVRELSSNEKFLF